MEIFILLIPFLTCLILFIYFRKKVHLLEYLITLALCSIIFFGVRALVVFTGSRSTECLGYYVTSIWHYESWNEWIKKTCTREVEAGTDSKGNIIYRTESYDCSYVRDHPEYWTWSLNHGKSERISYSEYARIRSMWTSTQRFVDMHRNYHTKDGNAWTMSWDGIIENARCVTKSHGYVNPIKGSSSTYKSQRITRSEAKSLQLYDFPKIENEDQNPILARHPIPENTIKRWKFFNAFHGYPRQIRVYLLFYYDEDMEISNKQAAYWYGGNKNELLIHVGVSSQNQIVQWANVTSWSDEPYLEVDLRNYILDSHGSILDLDLLADYIEDNIEVWKRKEFSDFKYLKYEFSSLEVLLLTVVMIIISIALSVIVVTNKYDVDYIRQRSPKRRR